jgi:hypothetical protein
LTYQDTPQSLPSWLIQDPQTQKSPNFSLSKLRQGIREGPAIKIEPLKSDDEEVEEVEGNKSWEKGRKKVKLDGGYGSPEVVNRNKLVVEKRMHVQRGKENNKKVLDFSTLERSGRRISY